MAKRKNAKKVVSRRSSLSDVDALYTKVLLDLTANRQHPRWEQAIRGVAALQELNGVLCRLLGASKDGDSEFAPLTPRR